MTIQTTKYARKPFFVDVITVTDENMEAAAEWCQGTVCTNGDGVKYVKVRVHRPLTEKQTQAFAGARILYAGTGYKVYTPKAFEKSFEPANETDMLKRPEFGDATDADIPTPREPSAEEEIEQLLG